MTNGRKKLKARFAAGEKRVGDVENEIRRESEQRLAELIELPALQRLQHFDDPVLTPADRTKLRQSIGVNLRRGKTSIAAAGAKYGGRRVFRWARRHWLAAIYSGIILIPAVIFLLVAWQNTGELGYLTRTMVIVGRLPDGETIQWISKRGDPIVVVSRSGQGFVVRHWNPWRGYATATIGR